jgi:hypothetical protein
MTSGSDPAVTYAGPAGAARADRSARARSAPPIAPSAIAISVVAIGSTTCGSGSFAFACVPATACASKPNVPNSYPPAIPRSAPSPAVAWS